ncbi:MAG: AMP-binding protein [Actinomycetota bacterium]
MAATTQLLSGFVPRPAEAVEAYRSAGLYRQRTLWRSLHDSAAAHADAPAVTDASIDGPSTLTYAALFAAAERRAAGLLAAGLEPGERVVLQLGNSNEFAVTLIGLLRAGLVPVMALPAHRTAEIGHLAERSGAAAYITEDGRRGFDHRRTAAEIMPAVDSLRLVLVSGEAGDWAPLPERDPSRDLFPTGIDPDDPCLFLISGGTTGLPKLIPRTHNDYDFNARHCARTIGLDGDDVYLVTLPAGHNFPLCCPGLLGMLAVGGHTVFTDDPSPDNAFDLIEAHGVTVSALVPALAQLWCAATEWEPADISSLRMLQVGGSKLAPADAAALEEVLPGAVHQVFGMAEGLICHTRPDDPRDRVQVVQGRPISGHDDVRIVDEHDVDVPDGSDGELLVRGPYTIAGYYRAEEHNATAFTPDGYYRSGDRVRREPDGSLVVTGRIKDTIIRAGENVAADEIEEHLVAHPSVFQSAVIGVPDDMLGERIVAALVLSPTQPAGATVDLADVRTFLTGRGLAPFKLPDSIHIARSLPVTAFGKLDKAALADTVAAEARP